MVLLGEGVRQGRARVGDPAAVELLALVQMAERDVVDAVERIEADVLDLADGQVALRLGRVATGEERVRHHDRTGTGGRPARSSRTRPIAQAIASWWVKRRVIASPSGPELRADERAPSSMHRHPAMQAVVLVALQMRRGERVQVGDRVHRDRGLHRRVPTITASPVRARSPRTVTPSRSSRRSP